MISTFKIKTTKGVHVQPYSEILLKKGKFINELAFIVKGLRTFSTFGFLPTHKAKRKNQKS